MRSFGRVDPDSISEKQRNDYVSDVDRTAEAEIIREIRKLYPDHAFLCEEGGASGQSRTRWIVDPLDGTTNYLRGIPHFAVSLGCEIDGQIQHAVVYDPARDELYTASRGTGAYLNQRRLRVSARASLDNALIGYALPFRKRQLAERFGLMFDAVYSRAGDVRRMGSAALDLAYVAAGRLDGYYELGLGPWDIAAGSLLVREAGGAVTDFAGGESYMDSGNVVAGPLKVLDGLLQAIAPHLGGGITR